MYLGGNPTVRVFFQTLVYQEYLQGAAVLQVAVKHCSGSSQEVRVQRG